MQLQSNRALQLRVLGFIDNTHAAPAEFGEDLVMADRGAVPPQLEMENSVPPLS